MCTFSANWQSRFEPLVNPRYRDGGGESVCDQGEMRVGYSNSINKSEVEFDRLQLN